MSYLKMSRYLLIALFAITTPTIICMDHSQESEQEEKDTKDKEASFSEKMARAKEDTYIRDNSIQYRMLSTTGEHAVKTFMEFCAKTTSDAILEVVKRELDIRYDNSPTIGRQLEEIASGITIIHNAVNLSDELAKKETAFTKYLTANNPAEQKKKQAEIDNDIEATLKGLRNLRNDHIDQLNAIRQKRNPNFKPYSQK